MHTTSGEDVVEKRITAPGRWLPLWGHKWLIVGLAVVSLAAAWAITRSLPKAYESTTTVLAPKEGGGGGGLAALAVSNLMQNVPGVPLPSVPSFISLSPNRDMIVSILKSRTLADEVVRKFDLRERYGAPYVQDAIRALEGRRTLSVSREGAVSIKIEDTDPKVAADIANFHVSELDRLFSSYQATEAGHQRAFVTQQLARARRDLEAAEESLRLYQERHKAVVLQDQTRGAIDAAARLKGEIIASEVQLQVVRSFATDANPDVASLRRRIEEMRRQLTHMEYGDDALNRALTGDRRDFYVPFARVPQVGLELARQMRDLRVQEILVTLLTQQLEQAKLVEARDAPLVQILDSAVPAERHSKPLLVVNLSIALVVALVVGVSLAFGIEWARNGWRAKPLSRG